MATTNPGLDYFPLDLNFYNDDKVALIEAEFGIKGSTFIIKLLFKIYREGYYCSWDDDICMLFARQLGAEYTIELVRDLIKASLKRNFFDRNLYEKYKILTSKGIQRRYFEAVSRRKRVDVVEDFILVDISPYKNLVCINDEIVNIFPENVDIPKQSKAKERKGEENREKENNQEMVVDPFAHEQSEYQWVMDEYNRSFGNLLPVIRTLTPDRTKKVEFCLTFWGEDTLKTVFTNLLNSSFLLGANKKGWRADFDWIFTEKNYLNLLENKYNEEFHKQFNPTELASFKRKQQLANRINEAINECAKDN